MVCKSYILPYEHIAVARNIQKLTQVWTGTHYKMLSGLRDICLTLWLSKPDLKMNMVQSGKIVAN